MSILKSTKTPSNVIVAWHRIKQVTWKPGDTHALLTVQSWPSQLDQQLGMAPAWVWTFSAAIDLACKPAAVLALETSLIDQPEHPMSGGTAVADEGNNLASIQQCKWAEIKQIRAVASSMPVIFEGVQFQADSAAQAFIQRKATEAREAVAGGYGWGLGLLSADNIMVAMNALQVVHLCAALDNRNQAAWDASQTLRAAIFAASADADSVNALAWPI